MSDGERRDDGEIVPSKPRPIALGVRPDVPRLSLADSLDRAGPGALVHIDRTGQVRSPARFRTLRTLTYSGMSVMVLVLGAVYTSILGPAGAIIGIGMGALLARQAYFGKQAEKAAVLISVNRIDEAEQILQRMLGRFLSGQAMRALVHQGLASVHSRRGDHDKALESLHRAMIRLRRSRRSGWAFPYLRICQYGEVATLCNLDRVREARERMNQVGAAPDGDYLRVMHWNAELFLMFHEGKCRLTDSELWDRAQRALRMSSSTVLLATCAWAYHQRNDNDMALHLLHEAFERQQGLPVAKTNPALWNWMETHRDAANETSP